MVVHAVFNFFFADCRLSAVSRRYLPVSAAISDWYPPGDLIGRHRFLIAKVLTVLSDKGCIVMNSVKAPLVKTDSHQLWDEACQEHGLKQEPPTKILLNDNHPIEILKAYYHPEK